jgi:hypothetical protein
LNPGGVTENQALTINFVGAFSFLQNNLHNIWRIEDQGSGTKVVYDAQILLDTCLLKLHFNAHQPPETPQFVMWCIRKEQEQFLQQGFLNHGEDKVSRGFCLQNSRTMSSMEFFSLWL